ncbi:hypothetical protein [Comamonas aquatica]|uniref:hypothetical protein n=1 Tax=Comamonas aquatica TaxID=225991 RepID=UPI0028D15881|nr:hypothetical protein [Comamonas aquatica]
MKFQPINRSQVVAALQENGPMTKLELAEYLGWTTNKVGTTISTTRNLHPEKIFRVVGHKSITGRRARDVSIYAAEAGPDVKKKPVDKAKRRKATEARYREKHRAIISARNQVANASKHGKKAINPWAQLAPPCLRAHLSASVAL